MTAYPPTPSTARVTVLQYDRDFPDHPDRFELELPVHLLTGLSPEQIAEAVYCAVDEPQIHMEPQYEGTLKFAVAEIVRPRRELAQVGDMRGFMVGDTVEFGDTRLRCDSYGWSHADVSG